MELPRVDAHAHIETTILPEDLVELGALVFAVTRESTEWDLASRRPDGLAVWGIGCHPAIRDEIRAFNEDEFRARLSDFALIGEIGLDARARAAASLGDQVEVFNAILRAAAEIPRPLSIHSAGASTRVLDCLERTPQRGAILHWWRGSQAETERAIGLDCFFSLNGAEVANPKVLGLVPRDRVLTETDFPHTRRTDKAANRPGEVGTVEGALAEAWGLDEWNVRLQIWKNVRSLFDRTDASRLPTGTRKLLLAVPG